MPQILVIRRMQHFSSEEFRTKEENQNDVWSTFFFFFYMQECFILITVIPQVSEFLGIK